jgi:uncharacterized protein (DUF697 family)
MEKSEVAQQIVKEHVLWSMGAGLIPIPIADIAAVTAVQLDMLKQLANRYEVDYAESQGKAWVSALSGSMAARIGANVFKLVPGIGSLIGGVAMSVLSGAGTYAVGQVFIRHFEDGGTFKDFTATKYKDFYKEQMEKGREKAREWRNEAKSTNGKSGKTATDIPVEDQPEKE